MRDKCGILWQYVPVAVALIDTHRLVLDLKQEYGFDDKQAEGVAEAIKRIDLNHLATKSDLRELENRMIKWMIPLMLGQAAVFALIVKWLVG